MTSLRLVAAACTLVASTSTLGAQRSDDIVARHRAVYSAVEQGLSHFQRAAATMDTLGLDRRSTDGGRLEAFCKRDTIRLFVAGYYGETGDATYRYYLDHDSLIFVLAESRRGRPNGRDPYPKRTIIEHERFYFSGDRLVRWLGNKNVPEKVTSAEARERASDLLKNVRAFKAVMPACHPMYAP
jgi:hypothetical protein